MSGPYYRDESTDPLPYSPAEPRVYLCRPELVEVVQREIDRSSLAGLVKVRASDSVPEGTVVIVEDQDVDGES